MKLEIDHTLPAHSKYYGCLDAPYRYGHRHIYFLAMDAKIKKMYGVHLLSLAERVKHAVLLILELIPILGHLVALIEYLCLHKKVEVIFFRSNDPFQMGVEQGVRLKKEIQFLTDKLLIYYEDTLKNLREGPRAWSKEAERYICEDYKQELHGIAKGAGVDYEDLLTANITVDFLTGCSLYAVSYDPLANRIKAVAATNHFKSNIYDLESIGRLRKLVMHSHSVSERSLKNVLKKVNVSTTVQAMILDSNNREIHMATASSKAANRTYTKYSAKKLFPNSTIPVTSSSSKVVKLARNLDWEIPILGTRMTKIFVRPGSNGKKSTAIVGWPGMIGAFSGINSDGLALALATATSDARPEVGNSNAFIFRQLLEESKNVKEALDLLGKQNPSSRMNLVLAGTDGIARIELDPKAPKHAWCKEMSIAYP